MDPKKIKKSIGKALSSSIIVSEETTGLVIKLKGKVLSGELLENETAYLGELLKVNKDIKVEIAANTTLGVYTIQWLKKLEEQVKSNGSKLEIIGLNAKHNKLLSILGTKLSA
jgi:hypothetical protein